MMEVTEATSVAVSVTVDDDEIDKAQATVTEIDTGTETAQPCDDDDEAMSKDSSAVAIDITAQNNDDNHNENTNDTNSIKYDNLSTECPPNQTTFCKSATGLSININNQSKNPTDTLYSPYLLQDMNYKHLLQVYSQQTSSSRDVNNNSNKDVLLCTLLQSISHHVHNRTHQLASSLSHLESKLQHVDYNVNRAILLDSLYADYQSVLVQNTDDDKKKYCSSVNTCSTNTSSESKENNDKDIIDNEEERTDEMKNSNKNSSGLEKMQQEEDEAIQQGFMALSIFHDHTASDAPVVATNIQHQQNNNNISNPYFEEEDMDDDDDDDDDSFYYYESSPGDIFNQRPLPFIIGSMEFLESVDGGIGGEDTNYINDNDEE